MSSFNSWILNGSSEGLDHQWPADLALVPLFSWAMEVWQICNNDVKSSSTKDGVAANLTIFTIDDDDVNWEGNVTDGLTFGFMAKVYSSFLSQMKLHKFFLKKVSAALDLKWN